MASSSIDQALSSLKAYSTYTVRIPYTLQNETFFFTENSHRLTTKFTVIEHASFWTYLWRVIFGVPDTHKIENVVNLYCQTINAAADDLKNKDIILLQGALSGLLHLYSKCFRLAQERQSDSHVASYIQIFNTIQVIKASTGIF